MQETFFLQAVPFCVSFVVLAFLTDCCSQSTSTSLSMYLNSWAVFLLLLFFFFFPSFSFLPSLCILLLAQRLPLLAFFSSCSGLPNRLLASFPPYLFAPSSPLPAQCQHHAPSSRIPLLLAPSPHLLPTCQAGSTPQFHQVAWGWGWACCHLNSLHPRQPEMESVINGTVPGSISSGNFKLMMFK